MSWMACVHALRPGRAVDVGGVAAQQQAADPQPGHHAAVDAEPRTPAHVAEAGGDVRSLVVDRLQLVERRRPPPPGIAQRIAGDQAESPIPHGEQAHEAVRRREDVEVGVRQLPVDVQVTEGVLLVKRLALELKVERAPHDAVGPLGANQPRRLHRLKSPVRVTQHRLYRRGCLGQCILGEGHQLHAALDGDALASDGLTQEAFGLRLREEEHEVVAALHAAKVHAE